MELFIFLQMGRTLEELQFVHLRPSTDQPSALDEAEAEREQERRTAEAIERFDVAEAESYVQADTERLLNVIEAGFGDLDKFNEVARGMFAAASKCRHAAANLPPATSPGAAHRRSLVPARADLALFVRSSTRQSLVLPAAERSVRVTPTTS